MVFFPFTLWLTFQSLPAILLSKLIFIFQEAKANQNPSQNKNKNQRPNKNQRQNIKMISVEKREVHPNVSVMTRTQVILIIKSGFSKYWQTLISVFLKKGQYVLDYSSLCKKIYRLILHRFYFRRPTILCMCITIFNPFCRKLCGNQSMDAAAGRYGSKLGGSRGWK